MWHAYDRRRWVYKEGRGHYEDNDLHDNAKAAVRCWDSGDPVVQANRIYNGRSVGILCYDFGKGHFFDNEIYGQRSWNVEVLPAH